MTLVLTVPLPDFCIPKELLLYEPRSEDVKQYFKNGDYERKIYTNVALDPHEKANLKALRAAQVRKGAAGDARVHLGRSMETRIPRYISHVRGDCEKALTALLCTQKWRREMFFKESGTPSQSTIRLSDADLREHLNSGAIYFCGRDSGMRPLLVVRAKVAFDTVLKLENPKEIIENLFAFCMEFALRYLFLPGKVETMVVILDLSNVSINQLRNETLRVIASLLSRHYVGRLYQLLVVYPPNSVTFLWRMVKSFISDRQQAKTVFIADNDVARDRCAKHQLEVQYGGSLPRLTSFYPFTFPRGPFDANDNSGPALDPLPCAFRCINARTARGRIAEGDEIPPIQWSSKGVHILKQLRLQNDGDERVNSRRSTKTDFPDDLSDHLRDLEEESEKGEDERVQSEGVTVNPSVFPRGSRKSHTMPSLSSSTPLQNIVTDKSSDSGTVSTALKTDDGPRSNNQSATFAKSSRSDAQVSFAQDEPRNIETFLDENSVGGRSSDSSSSWQASLRGVPERNPEIDTTKPSKIGRNSRRPRFMWCCAHDDKRKPRMDRIPTNSAPKAAI